MSQAQGRLQPPDAGSGRKEPPLELLEGAGPARPGPQNPAWTSEAWSPELGEDEFLPA